MEIPDVSKFSDNIPSPKDGNSRRLRQEILRAIGFLIQFYNAHTRYVEKDKKDTKKFFISFFISLYSFYLLLADAGDAGASGKDTQ
jgi:hypothetical protein